MVSVPICIHLASYLYSFARSSFARAAMLSIGKGDGTTAIDNLNAISNDANAEYYDANGRRTNGLQKGLNIVKRGSKTYKIMVK